MPDEDLNSLTPSQLRERALARWENEGGTIPSEQRESASPEGDLAHAPPLTNVEFLQLHIRVIALEGLVTALLAGASQQQIELVREMAAYISPRPGFTRHPLTIRAATQLIDLIERAANFGVKT